MLDRNELAVNSSNVVYTGHPISQAYAFQEQTLFVKNTVPLSGIS
jgi:hypothetical protein